MRSLRLHALTLLPPLDRRLFTGHMLWMGGSRTLHEYEQLACGADPQMLPTLLGLRLMTRQE